MNVFTKIAACAMVFASASMASAETINLAEKDFFKNPTGNYSTTGTEITTKGMTSLFSKQMIDVDPAKKYSFKMTVSNSAPKNLMLYVGFNLIDANGKAHAAFAWQGVTNSFTKVTRDAKKGDTVIYVEDGKAWNLSNISSIARNAKADNSDLPNTTTIKNTIKSKKQVGNEWELTLNAPLKADLTAGEMVRQHMAGGYFYTAIKTVKPTDTEFDLTGAVQGFAKTIGSFNGKQWPSGTAKAQIIILADWGTKVGTPLIFKNPTLTIE